MFWGVNMKNSLEIPEYVKSAILRLNENGYEAFLVGGSVRDLYMSKTPNDYDITTIAKPEEIIDVFSCKNRIIETGIKHGTVTVMYGEHPLEITTYRIDGTYINNRKPENVLFSNSIIEDLKRRDFTVNALIYNQTTGVLDYCGGINDINDRIIRCIGDPVKRFNEDALRILRALRFSVKLDFDIEHNTSVAIFSQMNLLKNISPERVFAEISSMFSYCGNRLRDILINYKQVLLSVLDILDTPCDYEDICSKASVYTDSTIINLSYYLARISKSEEKLLEILKKLKVSKSFEKQTINLFNVYSVCEEISNLYTAKLVVNKLGLDFCIHASKLLNATGDNSIFKSFVDEIVSKNLCVSLKQLNITGDDIIIYYNDITPQKIGKVLNTLLQFVMEDKVQNLKENLIKIVPEILKTL